MIDGTRRVIAQQALTYLAHYFGLTARDGTGDGTAKDLRGEYEDLRTIAIGEGIRADVAQGDARYVVDALLQAAVLAVPEED